jgi:hypothetical protein
MVFWLPVEPNEHEKEEARIFKLLSSRPYSVSDLATRLQRYHRMSTGTLEYLLRKIRMKLHDLHERFPNMDRLSHPQTGRILSLESSLRLINQVLDEREAEGASTQIRHVEHISLSNDTPKRTLSKQRKKVVEPLLRSKGWSNLDFANAAKVEYKTVTNFFAGCNTYRSTRKKLADALNLDVEQLP